MNNTKVNETISLKLSEIKLPQPNRKCLYGRNSIVVHCGEGIVVHCGGNVVHCGRGQTWPLKQSDVTLSTFLKGERDLTDGQHCGGIIHYSRTDRTTSVCANNLTGW